MELELALSCQKNSEFDIPESQQFEILEIYPAKQSATQFSAKQL